MDMHVVLASRGWPESSVNISGGVVCEKPCVGMHAFIGNRWGCSHVEFLCHPDFELCFRRRGNSHSMLFGIGAEIGNNVGYAYFG